LSEWSPGTGRPTGARRSRSRSPSTRSRPSGASTNMPSSGRSSQMAAHSRFSQWCPRRVARPPARTGAGSPRTRASSRPQLRRPGNQRRADRCPVGVAPAPPRPEPSSVRLRPFQASFAVAERPDNEEPDVFVKIVYIISPFGCPATGDHAEAPRIACMYRAGGRMRGGAAPPAGKANSSRAA
jgi:hypothetical protein